MHLTQSLQNIFQKLSSAFSENSDGIILDEKITYKPLQFNKIFKNDGPVIVEYGTGKGRFIKEYASKYPQKNFFGVEKVNKWVNHAAERVEKTKLENVRLVKTDAQAVLSQTPNTCVSEYYILFPDPWPKRRHQHRRIIQTALIHKIHQTLASNGKLYIATDHESYYQWMRKIIDPFLKTYFETVEDQKVEFISNYQVKYEREGRPIYSIYLQKK